MTGDPREALVRAGTELLDALYEHQKLAGTLESLREKAEDIKRRRVAPDRKLLDEILTGVRQAVSSDARVNAAKARYMTMRETLESIDGPRQH